MSPRRATHFSLLRQRKVSKRKATLLCVTPVLRTGATCDARTGDVPQNSLRACGAPLGQLRQVSSRSACVLRHTRHPLSCASRHAQKGTQTSNTGHRCAGPGFRGAQRLRVGGRAQRWPVWAPTPLLAAPAAGRLRGGMRVGARMLRCLARRSCPSGAPQARSEFCGAPRKRPAAGCPGAQRRGRRLGVALSLVTFFRRSERKLLPCRGHIPASAPCTGTPHASKSIAGSAYGISARAKKHFDRGQK